MGSVFNLNVAPRAQHTAEDFTPDALGALMGTGDYAGAMFDTAFDDSVAGTAIDRMKIYQADPNKREGRGIARGRGVSRHSASPDNLTHHEYRNSDLYREDLAFDPDLSYLQQKERTRQYDERQKVKLKLGVYEPTVAELVLGYGAAIAGAFLSPETFIPIGGVALKAAVAARATKAGWGARKATIAGGVTAGTVEGAVGSAAVLPIVSAQRSYMGDPISVAEMAAGIARSAAGGAILGGIGGAAGRKFDPDSLSTYKQKQVYVREVERQQAAIAEGNYNLEPLPETQRAINEAIALGKAYDEVQRNPLGEPDNPIVHITPEDIESTIMERRHFRDLTGIEVKGSGYGLVKFDWKHGKHSDKPKSKQITREDVTAFPHIIREYEAQEVFVTRGNKRQKTTNRQWVVGRGDGEWVLYADRPFKEDGERRMVTMHVLDDAERENFVLSERRNAPTASPRRDVQVAPRDTIQSSLTRNISGRRGDRQDDASEMSLAQDGDEFNSADFDAEVEVEQMRVNGELDEEDMLELAEAERGIAEAQRLQQAYRAAAICIGRKP